MPKSDSLGPQMGLDLPADFDMDIFRVASGLRELGKLEHVPDKILNKTCIKIEKRKKLHTRAIAGPERGLNVIFFSSKASILEEAFKLEKLNRARGVALQRREASTKLGQLLGYPKCCVRAFTHAPRQNDAEIFGRLNASLDHSADPLMNFFPRAIAPVGFVPCSLDCAEALEHARKTAKALEESFNIGLHTLQDTLKGIVLWFEGPLFLLFRDCSQINRQGFHFGDVVPSTFVTPEANAKRHQKGAEKLHDLASSLKRGNRVSLSEQGLVVYANEDEVFNWDEPKLTQRFISFAG